MNHDLLNSHTDGHMTGNNEYSHSSYNSAPYIGRSSEHKKDCGCGSARAMSEDSYGTVHPTTHAYSRKPDFPYIIPSSMAVTDGVNTLAYGSLSPTPGFGSSQAPASNMQDPYMLPYGSSIPYPPQSSI